MENQGKQLILILLGSMTGLLLGGTSLPNKFCVVTANVILKHLLKIRKSYQVTERVITKVLTNVLL